MVVKLNKNKQNKHAYVWNNQIGFFKNISTSIANINY